MAKAVTTEVALYQDYAIAQAGDIREITSIIAENLGGGSIGPRELTTIKVPAGGVQLWTVPTLEGEENTKTVEGIIIYARDVRRYWRQKFEERTEAGPPECGSEDTITGMGDPYGLGKVEAHDCGRCPFAQWGSDPKNAKGKACKEQKLLFILRPGEILPSVISVPPSSLAAIRTYMLRLTSARLPYSAVITSLGLCKEKNGAGVEYAAIVPQLVARLEPAQVEAIRSVRDSLLPHLKSFSDVAAEGPIDIPANTSMQEWPDETEPLSATATEFPPADAPA